MEAIIWHKGMPCKPVEHGWKVRLWHSEATGQRELLASRRVLFIPLSSDGDQAPCSWAADDGPDIDLDVLQKRAEVSAAKSAGRARRNCRHKIKHAGMTELLTLTTKREVLDLSEFRRHFAAWLRIMRRLIPGFRAVYGFERQTRGAWHAHVATDKLPRLMQYNGCKVQSWKVGTAVWRSVLGDGGLCFVGGRGGRFNRYSSAGKIAGYISKYLTKDNAAGEDGRRMWDSTRGLDVPKAVEMVFGEMPVEDVVSLAFELHLGESVLRHCIAKDGRMWLLHTEPAPEPT